MKKCYVEYVVTVWWNELGTREYRFSNFHIAYEMICVVRSMHPYTKITCKSERRDFPEWLNEIFTDT
mgnify:CR=1 FL=1